MTSARPSSGSSKAPEKATSDGDSALVTSHGRTTIADTVVEKIAGLAAREVRGVHNLGTGAARAFGAVRERIPGARSSMGQGVAVEVGERQAAVDIEIVVEYGAEIGDLSRTVRRNVIDNIQRMTALEVTEVNIVVNDVFVPGDDDDNGDTEDSRVQ